jgi:hypothetical protein
MSKIEKELLEALEMRGPKASEGPQDYFARLARAAGKLDDDVWEGLSKKTQDWVNSAADALNAKKKLSRFPDMDDDEFDEKFGDGGKSDKGAKGRKNDEADDDSGNDDGDGDDGSNQDDDDKSNRGSRRSRSSDDDEDQMDKKKAGKKGGAKAGSRKNDDEKTKKAAKAGKDKPKKSGEKKERGTGAQVAIKRAVIKDPSISTEDIVKQLAKKGIEVTQSGASTIRSGTLQTLRLVKEIGMPKNID